MVLGGYRDESGDLKRNHCKRKKRQGGEHRCKEYNVAEADSTGREKGKCVEKTGNTGRCKCVRIYRTVSKERAFAGREGDGGHEI